MAGEIVLLIKIMENWPFFAVFANFMAGKAGRQKRPWIELEAEGAQMTKLTEHVFEIIFDESLKVISI